MDHYPAGKWGGVAIVADGWVLWIHSSFGAMEDSKSQNLIVYKIFTFDGHPMIIQTIQDDKTANETIDYFDTEWRLLVLRQAYPNSKIHLNKPKGLELMLKLSKKLSESLPFVRTDFYEINGKVFFSEFTFYSDAGFEPFHPETWDVKLGNQLVIFDNKK